MAREHSDDELRRMVAALDAVGGNKSKAARELGLNRNTFRDRLRQAEKRGLTGQEKGFTPPELPKDDIGTDELVEHMCRRFEYRHTAHRAKAWMPIKINMDGPIGICWFGDPHVDDDGCNWPLLTKHVEICNKTPGLFGANIGDTTNNWVGRLMSKFADQETSQKSARKLAKWFLTESGVNWLLWIMGNHDEWNSGGEILRLMNVNKVIMEDWQARVRLQFPNGREAKIWAAHNFKGNSQWNILHGPLKAAKMYAPDCHLFVAGHLHTAAKYQEENQDTGVVHNLLRVRGYKYIDHYGEKLGFMPQQEGAAGITVFNPDATSEMGFITCFLDAEEAADYLTYLRNK